MMRIPEIRRCIFSVASERALFSRPTTWGSTPWSASSASSTDERRILESERLCSNLEAEVVVYCNERYGQEIRSQYASIAFIATGSDALRIRPGECCALPCRLGAPWHRVLRWRGGPSFSPLTPQSAGRSQTLSAGIARFPLRIIRRAAPRSGRSRRRRGCPPEN